jgi:hypothetical protein
MTDNAPSQMNIISTYVIYYEFKTCVSRYCHFIIVVCDF